MPEYSKPIVDALAEIEKKRESVAAMQPECALAQKVLADFGDFYKRSHGKAAVSIGYEFGTVRGVLCHIGVDKHHDAGPILECFETRGWLPRKHEPYSDYEAIGRRCWYLEKEGVKHNIVIMAFFRDSESACKWVRDGEEIVPKYKLVCPDSEKEEVNNDTR